MSIKLKQLPDREPKKVTLTLPPQTYSDLEAYAALYEETYGQKETPVDLIPSMIDAFLASDTTFKRARKVRRSPDLSHETKPAKE